MRTGCGRKPGQGIPGPCGHDAGPLREQERDEERNTLHDDVDRDYADVFFDRDYADVFVLLTGTMRMPFSFYGIFSQKEF